MAGEQCHGIIQPSKPKLKKNNTIYEVRGSRALQTHLLLATSHERVVMVGVQKNRGGATILGACSVVAVVLAAIVANGATTSEFLVNFGRTLEWGPVTVEECDSVGEVLAVVEEAKNNGRRVKGLGTGWSWSTTIASDDNDVYIVLTGGLADASVVEFDLAEPSVVVGAGVRAFDLYLELQDTGFNIEAKGNCLTAGESQTIGGLLSTNVHHTGIRTFYDVVQWVDVVTANGLILRAMRDDDLFRLTIGGGGRTGIIVQAKFDLAPRATYEDVSDISQPSDDSFEAFFAEYVQLTEEFAPMEFIALGLRPPGIYGRLARRAGIVYTAKRRMATASSNPAILPPNYGDQSFIGRALVSVTNVLALFLPPLVFDGLYLALIGTILQGVQPETEGTSGEDLDVASSLANTPQLAHQELEFYVPTNLARDVGAFMDDRFASGDFPVLEDHTLYALRKVFGSNSLTAANGVMADGSLPDYLAVNMDSYQRSQWSRYNTELNNLLAELSARFPQQIRLHPGKYNPPQNPDPESQAVRNMIELIDPNGVFARDAYDTSFLTEPPRQ